ncbi:uncharacterized protein LOC111458915 [Cucurbita moschata]|uniref:Uncharacterized protein LOC111458915 n=1 Tax=Cucurbita moschata TaxID=3662 RepID=A0A6J1H0J1_CUCMO|nr:uncharacterized protein LOC111458915 [Cucurbita moschata]
MMLRSSHCPSHHHLFALSGTSENPDCGSSTFSYSESSKTEPTAKLCSSSNWNCTSCCSFMPKPIHPLDIPMQTSSGEAFESTNLVQSLILLLSKETPNNGAVQVAALILLMCPSHSNQSFRVSCEYHARCNNSNLPLADIVFFGFFPLRFSSRFLKRVY